jgi:uncharacterized protein (TIGR03382 family)
MSDIMAAVCEAWKDGAITADTWKVGEDIWTPRTAGDALRYMTNPTMDGSSKDYYPERYTGTQDNGGVHTNSGIPNLAFYLLVAGGKHPRARTAIDVPALGMERAGAIFQRALTQGYFTTTTNFAQARTATEQVAQELYPGCTKLAVAKAWAAVGIGAVPTDAAPPTTEITAPADGATVEAGFEVQVNATDDLCVAKVELSIDGAVVATSSAPPYTFPTDMGLAPGTHTIQVTTYDSAGQSTDSATVTVPDAGGCCSTGGRGATGSLALAVAVAFALRRRRGLS